MGLILFLRHLSVLLPYSTRIIHHATFRGSYCSIVSEHLRTREDARLYLEACAEEDPGDGSLIRAALNDIARAQNMSWLAREIGMSREGLCKALSEDGNPTFATVMRITRALGMLLRITV